MKKFLVKIKHKKFQVILELNVQAPNLPEVYNWILNEYTNYSIIEIKNIEEA